MTIKLRVSAWENSYNSSQVPSSSFYVHSFFFVLLYVSDSDPLSALWSELYSFLCRQYLELPGRLDGRSLLLELQIVTWYTYLFAVGYCHLSKSLDEIEWPKQSIISVIPFPFLPYIYLSLYFSLLIHSQNVFCNTITYLFRYTYAYNNAHKHCLL